MNNNRVIPFEYSRGVKAYAIQDGDTKLFFAWCYKSPEFAEQIASKVSITSASDQQANWRSRPNMLTLSSRESFDD